MADLELNVGGRTYRVTCKDGEEPHLKELAEHLDRHAFEIARTNANATPAHLMLMAGLTVSDELSQALDEVDELKQQVRDVKAGRDRDAGIARDTATIQFVEGLARRIEELAVRIRSA